MKILNEELKNYLTGAVDFSLDGSPLRMTKTQREKFTDFSKAFYVRCNTTAGMRIKFTTDGDSLSFDIEKAGDYGVLMGDIPVFSAFYPPEDKDFPKHITVPLDKDGEKAVTLVYPNHQRGIISNVSVNNATYIKKYEYKRKFLFYGDSITQGMSSDRSFLNYASAVSQFFDAEILNQAVSGSSFLPETPEKIPYDPDIVFIGYGTNDFRLSPSQSVIFEHCEQYLKRIKELYENKKVVVITPIWRADKDEVFNAGTFTETREYIAKKAEENGFFVVDGFELVPHSSDYYADLRLHPNNDGFKFYSLNLIKRLLPIINK